MSVFDLLIEEVAQNSNNNINDCQANIETILNIYNVECFKPQHKLRMIAWDQK